MQNRKFLSCTLAHARKEFLYLAVIEPLHLQIPLDYIRTILGGVREIQALNPPVSS